VLHVNGGCGRDADREFRGPRRFAQLHSSLELLAERFSDAAEDDRDLASQ
jgi:hypothetical protein